MAVKFDLNGWKGQKSIGGDKVVNSQGQIVKTF